MKMKTVKEKFFLLIGFALLAGILYGVWLVFSAALSFLKSSPPEVAAAIVATSGTILLGIAASITERVISKNRDIAEAHRMRKIECYSKFLHKTFEFIHGSASAQGDEQKQKKLFDNLVPTYQEFTTDSVLWSSPGVLHTFQGFKTAAIQEPATAMLNFDDLMRAIREDLGHTNRGLKRGDLIKMILKDPRELDQMVQKSLSR